MKLSRVLVPSLVLLACSSTLAAQTTGCVAFPDQTGLNLTFPQGSPISIDFGQGFAEIASELNQSGLSFTYSLSATGSLPPGTTFSPSGLFSGTLSAAGTFTFSFNFSYSFSDGDFSECFSGSFTYTFIVTPYAGAPTVVEPGGLSYSLTQGGAATTQSVSVANQSGQAQNFTASASTDSGV